MDLNLASPLPFGFSIESGAATGADADEALADGLAGVVSGAASTGLSVGVDAKKTKPAEIPPESALIEESIDAPSQACRLLLC